MRKNRLIVKKRNTLIHVKWGSYNFIGGGFEGISMTFRMDGNKVLTNERTDVEGVIEHVR